MENTPNYSNKSKKFIKGFTLVEILLVVGIFSVLVFASIPLVRGVMYQNDLESTSLLVVSTIRQAESNARNGLEDSEWGVRINYPLLILFKGNSYASRDASRDVNFTLNSNITFTGISEIAFSKMHAIPSTTGNIIFSNLNNITSTININAKGRLSY
jgi:prepilin-type N-terminal cleavage/methylation domain-containing protein